MSSVVISGDTSGAITLSAPAVAGTNTITLPAVTGTAVVTGTTPTLNGITFPATQVPSADANTLDDYEEGTWTATYIAGDNITGTPTLSQGRYTKVGNIVNVSGKITATVTSSNTFTYTIFPLPFTPAYITTGSAVSNSNVRVGTIQLTAAGNITTYFPAASAIVSGSEIFYVNATYQV
jgi:hypothetical protein